MRPLRAALSGLLALLATVAWPVQALKVDAWPGNPGTGLYDVGPTTLHVMLTPYYGENTFGYAGSLQCGSLGAVVAGNVYGLRVVVTPGPEPVQRCEYYQTIDAGTLPAGRYSIEADFVTPDRSGGPVHRFTTKASIVDDMTARGWTNEGVAMCVGAP